MQEKLRAWLGKKLKERGHGSQKELAEALGLEKSLVSNILRPRTGRSHRAITADELIKMAEFFGETPPLFGKFISPVDQEFYQFLSTLSPKGKENSLALLKALISTNPELLSSDQAKEKKK